MRTLALIVGLGVLILLAAAGFYQRWSTTPLDLPTEGLIFHVESGDTLRRISRQLAQQGVLEQPRLLEILARSTGADERILRGEYRLPSGLKPTGLLRLLQSGETIRYLVTLPEGIRLSDAIALVQNAEGVEGVLDGPEDPRLLALVAPATRTEGYFLPETYQYERGDSDLAIFAQAHRMMQAALTEEWESREGDLPYAGPYDALIMASIIEKETGMPAERAEIGGVFVRRLQQGMRLQTDPSVIYGLGDVFSGNLRRSHLRDSGNPYNTYRHHGLPPGPIALPGRAALRAALRPAPGETLYFVARGDGSHQFSASLEEHQAAVKRFQLQRRADYRSSPEPRG